MISVDVRELRTRLQLSQPQFAEKFKISLGTLRQWERGRREPDGPARVLLAVISYAPEIVCEAVDVT